MPLVSSLQALLDVALAAASLNVLNPNRSSETWAIVGPEGWDRLQEALGRLATPEATT
jgi:hypothetical protein